MNDEEPQVSWKVVEPGTPIVTADGEKDGSVSRLVGDPEADVFTGFTVRAGLLGGERLVPSERVKGIWPDHILVDMTKTDLEALPEYHDQPVVRVEPKQPGFFARLFGPR